MVQVTKLNKVKNLSANTNGANVTLTWSNVANATGYEIWVSTSGQKYVNLGTVEGNNTAIITSCLSGKTYEFKVRAYRREDSKIVEYGQYSSEKKIIIDKEQNEDVELEKVKNLEESNISENSVKIKW